MSSAETIINDSQKIESNLEEGSTMIASKILIITTGGTIEQGHVNESEGVVPLPNGYQFVIPEFSNFPTTYETVSLFNIDSRNSDLPFLASLAMYLKKSIERNEIMAVIITHGTDTMEQTAYFLQRTISSSKPIILTGAMRASDARSPDGPINLINCVKQALDAESINKGVTINFNGKIHSANHVFKLSSINVDAFSSGEKGLVGLVSKDKIIWYNNPILPPIISHNLSVLHDVPIIMISPGSTYDHIDLKKIKGMVIVGYGCGNVNEQTYELADNAAKIEVPVVLVTRVQNGGVFCEYGNRGGVESMKRLGVIIANELSDWRARIVLILSLSTNNNVDYIKSKFI